MLRSISHLILTFFLTLSFLPQTIFAQEPANPYSSFQSYIDATTPDFPTIRRVGIPLPANQKYNVSILEKTTNRVLPHFIKSVFTPNDTKATVIDSTDTRTNRLNLVDKNPLTSTTFNFDTSNGFSSVTLKLTKPTKTTTISYYLDSNVTQPEKAQISFINSKNELETIRNMEYISSNVITFPEVTADTFKIDFQHTQPLRLTEIEVGQPNPTVLQNQIVWLGQSNSQYRIYFDSDRYNDISTLESFNTTDTDGEILLLKPQEKQPNLTYKEEDTDGDSIPNKSDNCPTTKNKDQKDIDGNKKGDVCEDKDGDGVLDGIDNCTKYPNRNQTDTDKNSIGDICEDNDNDSIPNNLDNCPDKANLDQKDTDQDKKGDVCDTEESRFFERKEFLNWLILGGGAIFIGVLGIITIKRRKP
jgi:Thrombospondin type 3 repeat